MKNVRWTESYIIYRTSWSFNGLSQPLLILNTEDCNSVKKNLISSLRDAASLGNAMVDTVFDAILVIIM